LKTIVIERWALGGQASSSPKIENYLGFPKGIWKRTHRDSSPPATSGTDPSSDARQRSAKARWP